jgi:hypothetical protein
VAAAAAASWSQQQPLDVLSYVVVVVDTITTIVFFLDPQTDGLTNKLSEQTAGNPRPMKI